jgi:hypothetical protein
LAGNSSQRVVILSADALEQSRSRPVQQDSNDYNCAAWRGFGAADGKGASRSSWYLFSFFRQMMNALTTTAPKG